MKPSARIALVALLALGLVGGIVYYQTKAARPDHSLDADGVEPERVPVSAPRDPDWTPLAERMAEGAPPTAEVVLAVRSLRALLTETGLAAARHGALADVASVLEEELGMDVLDPDVLTDSGFDPDRAIVLSVLPGGLTLVRLPARDPARFADELLSLRGEDEVAPTPETVAGLDGVRLPLEELGGTGHILRGKDHLLVALTEGVGQSIDEALAAPGTWKDAWKERLHTLRLTAPEDALVLMYTAPLGDEEEAFPEFDLTGDPLLDAMLGGMRAAANQKGFYEEREMLAHLAIRGNGVRLEMRSAVANLPEARKKLRDACGIEGTLGILPESALFVSASAMQAAELPPIFEAVKHIPLPMMDSLWRSAESAWAGSGLGESMWDQEARLRCIGGAFYGAGEGGSSQQLVTLVEVGGTAATEGAVTSFLGAFVRGVPNGPRPPTLERWEDFPVWVFGGLPEGDGIICSLAGPLMTCGSERAVRKTLALHKKGGAKGGRDLVVYIRADAAGFANQFMSQMGLGGAGVEPLLRALGTVTFTEELTDDGASVALELSGGDKPVLAALAAEAIAMAGAP